MRLELRQLRYFVAVAEERHFGRAAERVFVAQPSLSAQIARLESDLGVRLLVRDRRGTTLTAAGERLLEVARDTLDRLNAGVHEVRRVGGAEPATLRVAVLAETYLRAGPVAPLLAAFRRNHPSWTAEPRVTATPAMIAALLGGSVDVGFAHAPLDDGRLEARVVGFEAYCLAVPQRHACSRRASVALAELASERFLLPPAKTAPERRDEILGFCRRAGFRPKTAAAPADLGGALDRVAAGQGVCLVPTGLARPHDRVAFVPLSSPATVLNLLAIWRRGAPAAPMIAALLERDG